MPGKTLTTAQVLNEVTANKWTAFLKAWKDGKIAGTSKLHTNSADSADDLIEGLSGMKIERGADSTDDLIEGLSGMKIERDSAKPSRTSAVAANNEGGDRAILGAEGAGGVERAQGTISREQTSQPVAVEHADEER